MGAIAEQLAQPLREADRLRLQTRVAALVNGEDGSVTGVRLQDGAELEADAVVLSVPAPEAARLTGLTMPKGQTGTVNLYWKGDKPVYDGRKLVLNANPEPFVNNAVQLTNVAREYAPPGRHLLSASVVGNPEGDDATLFALAMNDLRRMFRGDMVALAALDAYKPLKLYRIPYSQFAQPPGIHPHLPDNVSGIRNLYFAAEFTEASSQNAAMISAEKAVEAMAR
jgi:phytoene dehydrogenase-like protein